MSSIWWEQVPNARRFINTIGEKLHDGRSVALFLPKNVPWADMMYSQIDEIISDPYRSVSKISDDKSLDPGELIFNKYCKPEVRNSYRPNIGFAKFLADRDDLVLKERYIWIKYIGEGREVKWLDFISEYHKNLEKSKNIGAAFIIELPLDLKVSPHKGVDFIKYDEYIHPFDCNVYNTLLASSIDKSNNAKQYLAELITEVTGQDLELASLCGNPRTYEQFMRDPYGTLEDLNGFVRSDGETFEFDFDRDKIEQRVWNAQIKILFPRIEELRLGYTERYSNQIMKYLPMQNEFGINYEQPSDVEIGVLSHMISNQDISVSERDKLVILHCKDARNDLAHLITLSYDKLMAILD